MDHSCKTCGYKDPTRGRRARHCSKCVDSLKCEMCAKPHGRKAGSKYCLECLPQTTAMYHPKELRRVKSANMQWGGPSYLGVTPNSHDWARLAAYIDGEGSIGLVPRKTPRMKQRTLCGRIVVTNTDVRLAQWCIDTFGMRVHGKPKSPGKRVGREQNWKSCYYAVSSGFRAAWISVNCLPWFLLKRQQAEVLIDHQKTTEVGAWSRGPGSSIPTDILEYRNSLKERMRELNRRGPREENEQLAKEA